MSDEANELVVRPIGVIHTPFTDRHAAPRQPEAARGVEGRVVLSPHLGLSDAIADLAGWQYLWLVFWFHLNQSWRPKVLPPRSLTRRGVLATRSPYRPNPIGLSVVELVRVEGLTLHVRDVDMIDGTPLLDVKPYLPYTDARTSDRTGWLGEPGGAAAVDPDSGFDVEFAPLAEEQLAWLGVAGTELRARLTSALALGPQPHAYRRIRREGDAFKIALKAWRAWFVVRGRSITVQRLASGYRVRELLGAGDDDPLAEHRRFVERWGTG